MLHHLNLSFVFPIIGLIDPTLTCLLSDGLEFYWKKLSCQIPRRQGHFPRIYGVYKILLFFLNLNFDNVSSRFAINFLRKTFTFYFNTNRPKKHSTFPRHSTMVLVKSLPCSVQIHNVQYQFLLIQIFYLLDKYLCLRGLPGFQPVIVIKMWKNSYPIILAERFVSKKSQNVCFCF